MSEEELKAILVEFGKECYWYGEDTGDYSMKELFGSFPKQFAMECLKKLLNKS